MTQRGAPKKTKLVRGDIFVTHDGNKLVRIKKFETKDHIHLGDCLGCPTSQSFERIGPVTWKLDTTNDACNFNERDYRYVRPSKIIVKTGKLSSKTKLVIDFDAKTYLENTAALSSMELYNDTNSNRLQETSLDFVLSNMPMFRDEQPLAFKIMREFGHDAELSPKTYAELAGRGIEFSNGRSKLTYRNRCTHEVGKMEMEIRYSFSLAIQPPSLTAKYERRTQDYMRSYRMGVLSKDLQKMANEIKTHRNMLDRF